jgi:hypothetical protein
MHRYETSTPRVAFGITAVAMTAITIGVMVILPAKLDAEAHEPSMLVASKVTTVAPTNAVTGAAIDVVAAHEAGLATGPCTSSKPNREPEG